MPLVVPAPARWHLALQGLGLACVLGWGVAIRPAHAWWLCAAGWEGASPAVLALYDEAAALCPERDEIWAYKALVAERLAEQTGAVVKARV